MHFSAIKHDHLSQHGLVFKEIIINIFESILKNENMVQDCEACKIRFARCHSLWPKQVLRCLSRGKDETHKEVRSAEGQRNQART